MNRDPARLDDFYEHFKKVHKAYFPDQRFGQLVSNFFGWIFDIKKRDPFFYEEGEMSDLLDEYVDYLTQTGAYAS